MGCKIVEVNTKDGEASELFKSLASVYPDAVALEKYTEIISNQEAYIKAYGANKQGEPNVILDPGARYKLAEFSTPQEQYDAVDFLANRMIDHFKTLPGVRDTSNISGINMQALKNIPNVMGDTVKYLRAFLNGQIDSGKLSSKQEALWASMSRNFPTYLVKTIGEGKDRRRTSGILTKRLAEYGVDFAVKSEDIASKNIIDAAENSDSGVNLELQEVTEQMIYDLDPTAVNTISNVSPSVKNYLASKRQVAKRFNYSRASKAGKGLSYEKTSLGTSKPVIYQELYSALLAVTAGVQSSSEMVTRIEEAVDRLPIIAPVLVDLLGEAEFGGDKMSTLDNSIYHPVRTALFATFSKQDGKMKGIMKHSSGTVTMGESNAGTAAKIAERTSLANALAIQETSNLSSLQRRLETFKKTYIVPRLNKSVSNTAADSIARQFRSVGFDKVTAKVVKDMADTIKNDPPSVFRKKEKGVEKPMTVQASFNALFDKVLMGIAKGKDILATTEDSYGETPMVRFISEAISRNTIDPTVGAYWENNGTMVNTLGKGTETQDLFKRLAKVEYSEDGRRIISKELAAFAADPMYSNLGIIQELISGEKVSDGVSELFTFSTFSDGKKQNGGQLFKELSPFRSILTKMAGYGSTNKAGPKYFYGYSPTLSDRGRAVGTISRKLNTSETGTPLPVLDYRGDTVTLAPGEVRTYLAKLIEGEVHRMGKALNNTGPEYQHYHSSENATRFTTFEELNDVVDTSNLKADYAKLENNPNALDKYIVEAMESLDTLFPKMIQDDIQYMVDAGVLKSAVKGSSSEITYLLTKEASDLSVDSMKTLKRAKVEGFLANNFIATHEMSMMSLGDPAFFKGTGAANKVQTNKRLGLGSTPGTRIATGEGTGIGETFKLMLLNEPTMKSEMSSLYKSLFDSSIHKDGKGDNFFSKIELADGSGFAAPRRFLETALSSGTHSPELIKYLKKEAKWKPGQRPIPVPKGVAVEVAKSFYFRIQQNEDGLMVPTSLKYSTMPVMHSYFESMDGEGNYLYPGMAEISKTLRLGKSDEVVVGSAMKTGQVNSNNIKGLVEGEPITLYNESYRYPQPSVTKNKTSTPMGSQIGKLIAGNPSESGVVSYSGEMISESEARDKYQKARTSIIEAEGSKVERRFSSEYGGVDKQAIVNAMLDKLDQGGDGFSNTDFMEQALSLDENKEPLIPFNYPGMSEKVLSMINSTFRSAVSRFKTPGYQAVQVTSMGMKSSMKEGEISVGSDLKFLTLTGMNGETLTPEATAKYTKMIKDGEDVSGQVKVNPAEVRVTPKYFENTLEKAASESISRERFQKRGEEVREMLVEFGPADLSEYEINRMVEDEITSKREEAVAKEVKRMMRLIKAPNGEYMIENIPEELLEVVLYRIPTQAKSSMLNAKVVGFLPSSMSSTIQVPGEIVEQAGSDFDIDKVFIQTGGFDVVKSRRGEYRMLKHKAKGEVTSDNARAHLLEFQKAILSSPNHMKDSLLPTATVQLEKIQENLGITDDVYDGVPSSLKVQDTFRENNKVGKELISLTSVSATAHSVASYIGAELRTKDGSRVNIGGELYTLGSTFMLDGKTKVSDALKELQNAALDNANSPILGMLNINETTYGAVAALVSGGHSLDLAVGLVNSPAIKQYAKIYPTLVETMVDTRLAQSTARRQALMAVGVSRTGTRRKSATKMNKLSQDKVDSYLSGPESSTYKAQQIEALDIFLEIKKVGDALSLFQTAMNFDSAGTPTQPAALANKVKKLAAVPGTLSNEANPNPSERALVIGVDKTKYRNHSLSASENMSILKPLGLNKHVSVAATDVGGAVLDAANKTFGFRLTDSQETHLLSELNTYLIQDENAHDDFHSGLSQTIKDREHHNWTDPLNPNSTANQVKLFKIRAERQGKTNKFIEELEFPKIGGRTYVTFNNTRSKAMTGAYQEMLSLAFEELMSSEDHMDRALAKNLADYAAVHYGFATSPNSYMGYLPVAAHLEYMGADRGLSVPQFYKKLELSMQDTKKFNGIIDKYLDLYVANNPTRLQTANFNAEQRKEALESDNPPKYINFTGNSKRGTLQVLIGDSKYVNLPLPVGERGLQKGYYNATTAETISRTEAMKDTAHNQTMIRNIIIASEVANTSSDNKLDVLERLSKLETVKEVIETCKL